MSRFFRMLGAAAAILSLGLVMTASAQMVEEGDEEVERYVLAPGDRIDISVLEDPSLNRQALILPDGRISLPIAGTLLATDKTPEQLAAEVQRRLASIFVTPPTVTVSAVGLGALGEEAEPPSLIYVLGEVRSPGAVPFDEETPLTVVQTLALVGGPAPFAARQRIQIHREVDGVKTVEIFDYDALESGKSIEAGPLLGNGDVIIVPERSLFD